MEKYPFALRQSMPADLDEIRALIGEATQWLARRATLRADAVRAAGRRRQTLCGLGAGLMDWAAAVARRDHGAELIRIDA
jgi:hypothetical protein